MEPGKTAFASFAIPAAKVSPAPRAWILPGSTASSAAAPRYLPGRDCGGTFSYVGSAGHLMGGCSGCKVPHHPASHDRILRTAERSRAVGPE